MRERHNDGACHGNFCPAPRLSCLTKEAAMPDPKNPASPDRDEPFEPYPDQRPQQDDPPEHEQEPANG